MMSHALIMLAGAFLFGTVYSVGAVGFSLMTRYLFGDENYGPLYSKVALFSNVGAAVSLTVIGYVYDWTGRYDLTLVAGALINVINALLLLWIYHKQRRMASEAQYQTQVKTV